MDDIASQYPCAMENLDLWFVTVFLNKGETNAGDSYTLFYTFLNNNYIVYWKRIWMVAHSEKFSYPNPSVLRF